MMMRAAIVSMLMLPCAVVAHADPPAQSCSTVEQEFAKADEAASMLGGATLRLDGDKAARLLDYINTKVGEPTDMKGETVIVAVFPRLRFALVEPIAGGCARIHQPMARIDIGSFLRAYKEALGLRV